MSRPVRPEAVNILAGSVEYLLLPLDRYHKEAQSVFDKAGAEGWMFTGAAPLRIGDPAKSEVDHLIFYRAARAEGDQE